MFLVVFTTLMISIVGLFAQVQLLQAKRMNNSQVGLMQTMVEWHHAATNLVFSYVAAGPLVWPTNANAPGLVLALANDSNATTGCMVYSTPLTSLTARHPISCAQNPALPAWLNLDASATYPPNNSKALPYGYQTNPYSFYSMAFVNTAGLTYVLTYLPVPPAAKTNLSLPDWFVGAGGIQIGYTIGDLQRQFSRSASTALTYGIVGPPTPKTAPLNSLLVQPLGGKPLEYPVPLSVPVPSFGILSLTQ